MRNYYILERVINGKCEILFGDFDKDVVEAEKQDEYLGLKTHIARYEWNEENGDVYRKIYYAPEHETGEPLPIFPSDEVSNIIFAMKSLRPNEHYRIRMSEMKKICGIKEQQIFHVGFYKGDK